MSRILIYTKSGCPFCSLLKAELNKKGYAFSVFDLSDDATRQQFYDNVGVNTVPQLFLSTDDEATLTFPTGERVGGYSEVSSDWSRLDAAREIASNYESC